MSGFYDLELVALSLIVAIFWTHCGIERTFNKLAHRLYKVVCLDSVKQPRGLNFSRP